MEGIGAVKHLKSQGKRLVVRAEMNDSLRTGKFQNGSSYDNSEVSM